MTENMTFGGYDADEAVSLAALETSDGAEGTDLFTELQRAAAVDLDNLVRYPVRARPGWLLEFDAQIGASDIKRYNAAAKRGRKEPDARISSGMALIEKNRGIYKERSGGAPQQVMTPSGDKPLTIKSPEFLQMMGEDMKNPDAVRALCKFLTDAGVITMGQAVLREAGWAEDLTPLDPTNG